VPETYRYFKDLKEYKYYPATEVALADISQEVSLEESMAMERWAEGLIDNINGNIVPKLKRSKEDIDREIRLIEKVTDVTKKYIESERVRKKSV
jgi:hypothetical protein